MNQRNIYERLSREVADAIFYASQAPAAGGELWLVHPIIRVAVADALGLRDNKGRSYQREAWLWLSNPPTGSHLGCLSDLAESIGVDPAWARKIACGAVQAVRSPAPSRC